MALPSKEQLDVLHRTAQDIRVRTLQMIAEAKSCHVGSCFSCVDILTALYFHAMQINPQNPAWPLRDRVVLSKGHAVASLYVTLAKRGFAPESVLSSYIQDGSPLAGHATREGMAGIEASTGSLGHGLSLGVGMALANRMDKQNNRVFVVLSDGECDEGSIWEAALAAGNFKLDNLVVIVDYNKIQSFGTVKEVMDLEPFADKWRAFKFNVQEIDGHNIAAIINAIDQASSVKGSPALIIAHTIKGKGVSFMENRMEWHYHTPNQEQVANALLELKSHMP